MVRLVVMNKHLRLVRWEWTMCLKHAKDFWFNNQYIYIWDLHMSDHLKIKRIFMLTHYSFFISTWIMKFEMPIFVVGSCLLDEIIPDLIQPSKLYVELKVSTMGSHTLVGISSNQVDSSQSMSSWYPHLRVKCCPKIPRFRVSQRKKKLELDWGDFWRFFVSWVSRFIDMRVSQSLKGYEISTNILKAKATYFESSLYL